ncbi:MAG: hypothetical protein ACTSYD_02230 [Candidatus Heimdallarchaeaceae archaeon]
MKIIFLEGVDGAGKTTKAKQLMSTGQVYYFRSSYQRDSIFNNEVVDLDESLKHDWRILIDFMRQIKITKPIVVDRGFISSAVYGKIIRRHNLYKWMNCYINEFNDGYFDVEYWFFIRKDSGMNEEEKKVNEEYKKVFKQLKQKGVNLKLFIRYDNSVVTRSFLNLKREIKEHRFDEKYYFKQLLPFIGREIFVSDIDGVIFIDGDINKKFIQYLNSKQRKVLLITGRECVDPRVTKKIKKYLKCDFKIIWNNHNLGLSSRVLKEYCLQQLIENNTKFVYFDDRPNVISHLKKRKLIKNVKKISVGYRGDNY